MEDVFENVTEKSHMFFLTNVKAKWTLFKWLVTRQLKPSQFEQLRVAAMSESCKTMTELDRTFLQDKRITVCQVSPILL